MVQFLNKDLVTEVDADEGVIVLDVNNLQGVWLSDELAMAEWAWPRVYELYKQACFKDYKTKAGTCMLIEDHGYRIVLMFTKQKLKDSKETLVENFAKCVDHLFQLVPADVNIYSPILGRKDGQIFCELYKIITDRCKEQGYVWNVCRKQTGGKQCSR